MRDKSSHFANSIRSVGFHRPLLSILAISLLAAAVVPETHARITAADRNQLRMFGFDRTYTGIVNGSVSSKTLPNASFTVTPVRVLHREVVPLPGGKVKSPALDGEFSILLRARSSGRKAVVTGSYYGTVYSTALGFNVFRSGTRTIKISKKGSSPGRYTGRFSETIRESAESNGVVYTISKVEGTLR